MDEVTQPTDDFCPYVGLQPYNEADQDYFFGRTRDSRVISSNLYASPLTILYGASGVGKSSVLRAGVSPYLQRAQRTAVVIFDGWADQNLLYTLKTRCLESIASAMGNRELQLELNLPLDEFLYSATQALGGTLMLILDQFEEYFLYHPEKEGNPFEVEFARLINREDVDSNVLLAMREDSLSRLDRFRARIPNMLSNVLRLRHLDAASARDAMRRPLEVYISQHPMEPPMSIEDVLVEELIHDIQVEKLLIGQGGQGVVEKPDGAEAEIQIEAPFLQLVLTRIWFEERAQGSQTMRLETLQALGGAGRIIRTHMDSAMNALMPEEQDTAAYIFRYMVTPSGTKIAYTVADLEFFSQSKRSLQPVLEKLAQWNVRIMRPVTSPGEPGVVRYQIYHDVLAPAVLDWRERYENSKQLLNLFHLLTQKGDMDSAFQVYRDIVQRTPQQAFFPARFEVKKLIGKAELGVTYLLFDREKEHLVAATILDPSYEFTTEELEQFVGQVGKLYSPRIGRVLGFRQHRDNTYLLSTYIDGPSLRARLNHGTPMSYQDAMQVAREITGALEDGHHQGLSHLNLRPSNIILSSRGVKLVNYGFSRLTSIRQATGGSARKYTDDYLAPEQLAGKDGDERSDIYAFGTILYEMLIGHPPSVGRFYYPSEVNLEATEAVDILIDHARENEPDRRFDSVEAIRAEIDRISLSLSRGGINQYVRKTLAWISDRYRKLTSGRGLILLLSGLAILLALSLMTFVPVQGRLAARLLLPLLVNSLVISIFCDWVIRALARRRGLGSLSTSGRGIGVILGLVFTLHLISVLGLKEISLTPFVLTMIAFMLALATFGTALALGILAVIARITERLFKSYTMGFYWSFIAIVFFEFILIVLRQPSNLIMPR